MTKLAVLSQFWKTRFFGDFGGLVRPQTMELSGIKWKICGQCIFLPPYVNFEPQFRWPLWFPKPLKSSIFGFQGRNSAKFIGEIYEGNSQHEGSLWNMSNIRGEMDYNISVWSILVIQRKLTVKSSFTSQPLIVYRNSVLFTSEKKKKNWSKKPIFWRFFGL